MKINAFKPLVIKVLYGISATAILLSSCGKTERTKPEWVAEVPTETSSTGVSANTPTFADTATTTIAKTDSLVPLPTDVQVTDWTIVPGRQVGKITRQTTFNDLKNIFGESQVVNEKIKLREGIDQLATKVYPNTPNEIWIFWKDAENLIQPQQVILTKNASKWQTFHGIRVGTTLEELNELNQKTFDFVGFEYIFEETADYSGWIANWNKGRLDQFFGGVLAPSAAGKKRSAYQSVLGGQKFKSDLPFLKDLEIRLVEMRVLL